MFLNPDQYFSRKKDWFVLSVFAGSFLLLKVVLIGVLVVAGKFVDMSEVIPAFDKFRSYDERRLFYILVVAPIFETLVAQYLIIKGLFYIQAVKKYPWIAILVSAIVFSLAHADPSTVAYAAIVLAYNFYYFNKKRPGSFAYWSTVLLHSFYNLVTYLLAHKYISVWL